MFRLCVFASGRGSNLKAIWQNITDRSLDIELYCVVSDKTECGALEFAKEKGIKTFSVSRKERADFVSYSFLIDEFNRNRINLIVLAGFLKKIPDEFIDAFPDKIINIHPALLPFFGGKGMYGMNVHKAVFESGMKVSGATVHFVDKIYDHGKIIAQRCVDISSAGTAEEIADEVLKVEHTLLPLVVEKFARGKILVDRNRVYIT